jgi:hypothetical protein
LKIETQSSLKLFIPLFWEYDFSSLDLIKDADLVIERVIEKGRIEHLKILFKLYPKEKIFKSINNNINISASKKNLWALVENYE